MVLGLINGILFFVDIVNMRFYGMRIIVYTEEQVLTSFAWHNYCSPDLFFVWPFN